MLRSRTENANNVEGKSYSPRSVAFVGLYLALLLGSLELMVGYPFRQSFTLDDFGNLLTSASITILVVLCAYSTVLFFIGPVVRRYFRLEILSSAYFLAASVGLVYLSIMMFYLLDEDLDSKAVLLIVVFIIGNIPSYYFLGRFFATLDVPPLISAAILTLPLIFFETSFFMFFPGFSYKYLIYSGCLLLTIFLFWIIPESFIMYRTMPCLAAIFFLASLGFWGEKHFTGVGEEYHISREAKTGAIKHVILLTVDTLRPDVLSSYTSDGVSTPNIDSIAKDGVIFRNAISSAPWTLPSFASIMTGVSPFLHMTNKTSSKLSDNFLTLPEALRDRGYYTAAIGHNVFLGKRSNISQGFLEYEWYPKSEFPNTCVRLLRDIGLLSISINSKNSSKELTRLATSWLKRNHSRAFFLWIHYMDPHAPYSPPIKFRPKTEPVEGIGESFWQVEEIRGGYLVPSAEQRNWITTLYRAEVQYVDEEIGKVLKTLKDLGIYEESLLVFASDHGEEFWEHGGFEHGHTVYNELLWVPLFLKLPRSLDTRGKEIATRVSTESIMPTILEYCDANLDKNDLLRPSLSLFVKGKENPSISSPIFSTGTLYSFERESVIVDNFKFIKQGEPSEHVELYDLTSDSGEERSSALSFPEELKTAETALMRHKEICNAAAAKMGVGEENVALDEETMEQLRKLGYVR